jgi:hypothetical protein
VIGAHLGIVAHVGDPTMDRSPAAHGCPVIDGRTEQRVSEMDGCAIELDEARRHRFVDRGVDTRPIVEDPCQVGDGWSRQRCQGFERRPRGGCEGINPFAEEALEVVWDRQRLPGQPLLACRDERGRELEGVERVPWETS